MPSHAEGRRPGGDRRAGGHEEAWNLLPWFVNGTLAEGERREVGRHLEACGICREEVRYLRQLARSIAADEPAAAAEPGAETVAPAPGPGPNRAGAPRRGAQLLRATPQPVRWALAAQLAGIAVLAALLLAPAPGGGAPETAGAPAVAAGAADGVDGVSDEAVGSFRTLSDPAPPAAGDAVRLRLVFAPSAREREIRGALIAVGGAIVGGPSPTGVYTVELPAPGEARDRERERATALATLRGLPQVVFAEPAAGS